MNLVKLESHTVDVDAIPEAPVVLDVGCRGFDFANAILELRPQGTVVAMEPDPTVTAPETSGIIFLRAALVGDDRKESLYAAWSTGEGNIICDVPPWYAERADRVMCTNLTKVMRSLSIPYFDVVKLDCEGSEYNILENWPGPIAGQISVEFHDWTGPWEEHVKGDYYSRLFSGPLKHYDVLTHELSKQGEGVGHWDSVLRLKK